MLRKLTQRRFLLFLGAILFALHGVLHPLFHAEGSAPAERNAEAALHDSSGERHALCLSLHCPVCSGVFHAADVPESLSVPPAALHAPQYAPLLQRPASGTVPESCARAPPLFS
ncbi:MAG: hypothetical protein HPZ91_19880 [Lentisphaeria bacterium]|nr:hypothetical protein [Lentisphaeria bacterium]